MHSQRSDFRKYFFASRSLRNTVKYKRIGRYSPCDSSTIQVAVGNIARQAPLSARSQSTRPLDARRNLAAIRKDGRLDVCWHTLCRMDGRTIGHESFPVFFAASGQVWFFCQLEDQRTQNIIQIGARVEQVSRRSIWTSSVHVMVIGVDYVYRCDPDLFLDCSCFLVAFPNISVLCWHRFFSRRRIASCTPPRLRGSGIQFLRS